MAKENPLIEKVGHIKNPLTVIAIFAGIAEISGTTVLPFIESKNQDVFIWFLMIFPIFLVGAFFFTLNFNHKVLYAPSDYKDESNFLKMLNKASPEEQEEKLLKDIAENAEDTQASHDTGSVNTSQNAANVELNENTARKQHLMATMALAEKLSINNLARNLNLYFETNVKIKLRNQVILFDALATEGNKIHAVEVKLFSGKNSSLSRFDDILNQALRLQYMLSETSNKKLIMHLYAVIENQSINKNELEEKLKKRAKYYNIETVFHVVRLNELQEEYEYSI